MSSEETKQTGQHFEIQKIYIKDLSLEVPHTPLVYTQKWEPEINVQLNSQAHTVEENPGLYEVVLSITVEAKNNNEIAFLVEIQQAGVFLVQGFSEQETGPMLGSFSPNVLFPYAREAISDLVTRGGFPQLLLAPVNFDALYAESLKHRKAAKDKAAKDKADSEVTH